MTTFEQDCRIKQPYLLIRYSEGCGCLRSAIGVSDADVVGAKYVKRLPRE
jgi:hypothetical protein